MATTTTNLGLTKPDYTDAADIAVINTNMDTVDAAITAANTNITATKSDLGIVEDGNTATHSITAGQYVIWKGNLYTASSAIATGTTLSTSNLTAVSNGGLNSLNEHIATRNAYPFSKAVTAGSVSWFDTNIAVPSKDYIASVEVDNPNVLATITTWTGKFAIAWRSNGETSTRTFKLIVVTFG